MPRLKLEDYQLGSVMGGGTSGTIYSATEHDSGKPVAIKRLHPAASHDRLVLARFRREMTILERLRHPNIIAYYGGGEDATGNLFYVMELIEGGSVRDLMTASGPLPWQVVVNCGRQICSALQCAHNHGVIHRDLKPSNLFLTLEGVLKLGDFGVARDMAASDLTSEGLTVGTHAYMAPEQITGDASISGKADLYALGCCLYEMLTGQKPYNADTFPQLFAQHLHAERPRPSSLAPDCPPELDQIVVDLLAKNPEDRPFNARGVQAKMLQIAEKYHVPDTAPNVPKKDSGQRKGNDVPAGQVNDVGEQLLRKHIEARLVNPRAREATLMRLVVVLSVVLVIVIAVLVLKR